MIKIILSVMGLLILCANLMAMFKKPTIKDESIKGNSALLEVDRANDRWREIGRIYQFLSMPIQWLIFSVTLALSYFSLLSTAGVYFSISLLVVILSILLFSMKGIKRSLALKEQGAEHVTKTLKSAIRASSSFPIVIYVICVGI